MKSTIRSIFAALSAAVILLSACGTQEDPPATDSTEEPFVLTAVLGTTPDTLDPARCTAEGGETILFHLYENLMRWENSGTGFAVLAPGQAESYTVETDYLGNATYTFTLRDDIFWSDGQPVTAHQFVASWQRLANPANDLPHRKLLQCITGYDAVQESGDVSLLGVSAADSRTLIVKLNGNPPSFLHEVCSGAYTMPVRTYLPDNAPITSVTNGAYTLAESSESMVTLTKSESYYDAANVTVDVIRFIPSDGSDADYAKFTEGTVNFTSNLPASALEVLAQDDSWLPEPVTSTCGVVFNTLAAPFDDVNVRAAFRLVIDEQAIVDALNDLTLRPATGLVPYGVADYGVSAAEKEAAADDGSNSGKPPLRASGAYWDFRVHSEEIVTLEIGSDYAADCDQARKLLASAGYAGGSGFPQVEYIYINTPESSAVAKLLQAVWKSELGVTVTLRAVTAEEYGQLVCPSEDCEEPVQAVFQIAAAEFTVSDRYDVSSFLSRWHSSNSAVSRAGYASAAFDILLNAADAAVAAETYDAYLHDAEAILLEDAPVIPLFYRGGSYALSDALAGFYRLPNSVYFFSQVKDTTTNN